LGLGGEAGAWFEVYYVSGVEIIPAYLVIIAPERFGSPEIIVREAVDQRRVIYHESSYEAVKDWLSEDDFYRVLGREFDFLDSEDQWFEVWYEPGMDGTPRQLLVVTPESRHSSRIQVLTPYPEKRVFKSKDYDDALTWLNEHDFHQVSGRHQITS
jgi:hypothetical protein